MRETKVYLVLTDTGSVLSRTIKLFTQKKYNHCSLSFDSQLESTYSFGRRKPENPFIGGFVQEDTRSDYFLAASCAVYSLEVTKEQKQEMQRFVEDMVPVKSSLRYNLLGLLAVPLNVEWSREDCYFCSQFVATTLMKAGVFQPEKALSLVTPHDILHSLSFELVYEGTLRQYHQGLGLTLNEEFYPPAIMPGVN